MHQSNCVLYGPWSYRRPVFWSWRSADYECFSGLPKWLTRRYAMVWLKKLYFHPSEPNFCQIKYAVYSKFCFFIFDASFDLMHSALPFLFISSFPPHCPPPNGWAQCRPLPAFQVGPIFSPSCACLRGCMKVGTVCECLQILGVKGGKETKGVLWF